jgi:hypothetical protein
MTQAPREAKSEFDAFALEYDAWEISTSGEEKIILHAVESLGCFIVSHA